MNILERLINNFSRLPGIGKKSAARIVYYLLKSDFVFTDSLAREISNLKKTIKKCNICGNYTEGDPCYICMDLNREKKQICVVEEAMDVLTIESTGEYKGEYHVLGGNISPIDGIGPEDLMLDKLHRRAIENGVKEIIVATNPTVEGDTTALFILKMFKDTEINITRLASGLPVGGDLEYAGKLTLARSLKGRTTFSI